MIALLLALVTPALDGPGIRHAADQTRWPRLLETYDRRGKTARLLDCDYRYQLAGTDPLPGLVRNRAFMAILLAKDGAIEPWDLEPAWPTCKFLAVPDEKTPR